MSCGSTNCTSTNYSETARPPFPSLKWSWKTPPAWLVRTALECERRHQRRQLLELDDRLLADIGISRQQAVEEALKSSWTHLMWHAYRWGSLHTRGHSRTSSICMQRERYAGFGDGFAVIVLPVYLLAIGLTPQQVGIVASASLLGTAALTLLTGFVAPRYDLRNLFLVGAGLATITGL